MTSNRSIATDLTGHEKPVRGNRSGFAWLAALVLIQVSVLTAAEEIKLNSLKVGSRTYRRVKILGVSVTDLYFRHADGISNVKLRNLSPELQKRFDYDPEAAKEAERQQMEEDSAYIETVAVDIETRAQKAAAAAAAAAELAAKKAASTEASLADPISGKSLVNQPAPELDFGVWLGDEPDTEGKAMLIFFWATWSAPCHKMIDEMNGYQRKFRNQLVVIGWSTEEESAVSQFNNLKIEFPLTTDPQGALATAAGVNSVPQAMLIDAQGVVRYVGHPAALNAAALKRLLAKPAE